tara:strand:+ start:673 stop:1005 length:333 start_codon:yes stop_codon:yes gene_type:complete
MYRLQDLLGDYEEPITISNDVSPISPSTSQWTLRENPERLTKMVSIPDEGKFNSFVVDLLELQAETQHHGRLTVQFPRIKMEIWTYTLMTITELDTEWTRKVDDILEGYK